MTLREAHAHLHLTGRSLAMCDLSACASVEDALDRLARHAPDACGWVLAHGARPESWDEPRWPSRAELDRVRPDRPLAAWCFDHHALVANSRALAAAGIDRSTRVEHGVVELDASGDATGLLLEHAAGRLWASVPEPRPDAWRAMVRAALDHFAALGFAEVHDLRTPGWLPSTLADLEREGALACDVVCWALVEEVGALDRARGWFESGRVRLGGGKVFVDGTLNSRTAWVLEPYADAPPGRPCGTPMMTPGELDAALRACDAMGLPLAAHAIGDGAVRAVLDAVERVRPRTPGSRVAHAELVHPEDVPRFVRLGVTASVQPCHLLVDAEALARGVPDRLDRVLPVRALLDSGLAPGRLEAGVVFGSDAPIVRADPGDSIVAATARRRPGEPRESAVAPEHAITESEAQACFARS